MNEVSEQAREMLAAELRASGPQNYHLAEHILAGGPIPRLPSGPSLRAIEKALALSASSDATGWEGGVEAAARVAEVEWGLGPIIVPRKIRELLIKRVDHALQVEPRTVVEAAVDAAIETLANLPSPPTPPPVESETSHEQ